MMSRYLLLLAILLATVCSFVSAAPIRANAARKCNGDASLCNKRYGDVVYIGAHNSYSWGKSISSDQTATVSQQLDAGIRLLQNQGHDFQHVFAPDYTDPSNIHLCHTSCYLLDGGSVEAYLSPVRTWLARNPDEVLTILFTNPDGVDIARWAKALDFAHLVDMAYVPPKQKMTPSDWPTLAQMIDSGKRLVIFIDSGADQSRYPYILDEFSQVYENPYDQLTLPLNCSADRGHDPENSLFLLNETKDESVGPISIPDTGADDTVNSANGTNGIVQTVQRCAKEKGGKKATFVLVDFFDTPKTNGSIEAARILNGLPPQASGNSTSTPTTGQTAAPTSTNNGTSTAAPTSSNGSDSDHGNGATSAASLSGRSLPTKTQLGLPVAALTAAALASSW